MREWLGELIDPDQIARELKPNDPRGADVASRVEQGGHWIAEEDIRFRYGQSLQNLKPALAIADQVIVIDNTYEPTIVADITYGNMIYCTEVIPTWCMSVLAEYE